MATVTAQLQNLAYGDFARSDETPATLVSNDVVYETKVTRQLMGDVGTERPEHIVQIIAFPLGRNEGVSNVFMTESRLSMVLKLPEGHPVREKVSSPYILITGEQLTWPQFLDTCNAETIKHALTTSAR